MAGKMEINMVSFIDCSKMGDFSEVDHQRQTTSDSLHQELQKLLQTAPGGKADIFRTEFEGPSVVIEKLQARKGKNNPLANQSINRMIELSSCG